MPRSLGRTWARTLWVIVLVGACDRPDSAPPSPVVSAVARPAPSTIPRSPVASARSQRAGVDVPGSEPCGALGCRRVSSAGRALAALLLLKPEVIAFGESHAPKGAAANVVTATERFEKELLPILAKAGASELVLELLKPSSGCERSVEKTRQKQRVVTEQQAPKNQNRFVSLGYAARELRMVPFLLMPNCQQYESIAKAGADSVVRLLELISLQTERQVLSLWRKHAKDERRLILAYGGAMHNDVRLGSVEGDLAKQRASFSFGSALKQKTNSRYLAVDLIVPEFISDTDVWRALPWFEHFDRSERRDDATLFQLSEESFVIVLPASTASPVARPRPSVTPSPSVPP